jgi:hypothetical protein
LKIRFERGLFAAFLMQIPHFCFFETNSQKVNFRHLNINNGLSQYAIFAFLQKSEGFMRFSTKDGLNHFNSEKDELKSYKTSNYRPNNFGNFGPCKFIQPSEPLRIIYQLKSNFYSNISHLFHFARLPVKVLYNFLYSYNSLNIL